MMLSSSRATLNLNERLQEMTQFAEQSPHFTLQDATRMAEEIGELIYDDVEAVGDEANILPILYYEIKDQLSRSKSRERLLLVLQKLHLLLFGPFASPLLPLEYTVNSVSSQQGNHIKTQANTVVRRLTGTPDHVKKLEAQAVRAMWIYPKPFNGLRLGGTNLAEEIIVALQEGGFDTSRHISPMNGQPYYEIVLQCKLSMLPLKRQLEDPKLYEPDKESYMMNMF